VNLTEADLRLFVQLRIPSDLLEAAGIERVSDREAREVFGFRHRGNLAGIAIPYFLPWNGKYRVTARLRRDHPEMEKGKPKDKYISAYGDTRHLYFPPGARELLVFKGTPLVFVEAEKSALALLAWSERVNRKLLPIGTGGCWGWRGRIGKTTDQSGTRVDELGPVSDLECARNREAYILFDANSATNQKVQAARREFARELQRVSATVHVLNLPVGEWNGPDDYLAAKIDEDMVAIFDKRQANSGSAEVVEPIAQLEELPIAEMPDDVLCGRLGEICAKRMARFPRAYAWPAIVTCAAVLANQNSTVRSNLNFAACGPVGSGKTVAIGQAAAVLGLGEPHVVDTMAGSVEGLFEKIKDANGTARIYSPDELAHLFAKAQIENSSFCSVLNRTFNQTRFDLTVAGRKVIPFNCSLSIAGGVVLDDPGGGDNFGECFGSATTAGMYDRFLFGRCPRPFPYTYRPLEGGAEMFPEPTAVNVAPDIWEMLGEWRKNIPGMTGRVPEISLRIACICAGFDQATLLRAESEYMQSALAFAKYQIGFRSALRPNAGTNDDAKCAFMILQKLNELPPGEWVHKRIIAKRIHAERYGPGIFRRCGESLILNGDIERIFEGTPKRAELWRRS
jgi:hypothetical protein